jgi:hypothetical protein
MGDSSPDTPIVLRFQRTIVPKGNLHIDLPMADDLPTGEELAEALRQDGHNVSVVFPAGGGASLALMIAGAAGAATAIAKVLTAFFNKNQHRKITIRQGDNEFAAQGLSLRQLERLIKRAMGEPDDEDEEPD